MKAFISNNGKQTRAHKPPRQMPAAACGDKLNMRYYPKKGSQANQTEKCTPQRPIFYLLSDMSLQWVRVSKGTLLICRPNNCKLQWQLSLTVP